MCMYVYHMHVWSLALDSLKVDLQGGCELPVGAGTEFCKSNKYS